MVIRTQSLLKQVERRFAKTMGLGMLYFALGLSSTTSTAWAMGKAPNEAEKQAATQAGKPATQAAKDAQGAAFESAEVYR